MLDFDDLKSVVSSPRVEFAQISFAYPPQPGGTGQSWLRRKLASSAFSIS